MFVMAADVPAFVLCQSLPYGLVRGSFLPAANSSAGKNFSKKQNWMLGRQDLALASVFVKVNDRIIAICNVTVHISQLHSFPVFGPVLLSSVSVHKQ